MPAQISPADTAALFLVAILVVPIFLSLYRRREGIRHFARRIIVAEMCYLLTAAYLTASHIAVLPALAIGILVGIAAERLLVKKRTRHIPARVRRNVIDKYERHSGRKYDPRNDEFDHAIAFSRGGSSTTDNIRVKPRAVNRRKGRKSPWWDVLGRL